MSDQDHFDGLETRSADARERDQFNQLREQLTHAKTQTVYFAELLKEVDVAGVTDRGALARIPVTRKSDLVAKQKANPPFGGMEDEITLGRLFQSPGPIYDPEGLQNDYWCTARAFHAAGFRSGDRVLNTLSYHLTPGGFILDAGARACGCAVIPAGPGNTEQQLDVIRDLKPIGYCGTPSFLRILLEKAEAQGVETTCLQKALVTGGSLARLLAGLV